jgi:hypothetical protein
MTICATFLFAVIAAAQPQVGYIDAFIVRVKPEKRADFDVLAKKIADANRKNNGDNFICSEVQYGEQNTLYFTSARPNMAAIDAGSQAFESAVGKAFGAAAPKILGDVGASSLSSRGELRRTRVDLSSGFTDTNVLLKTVGASHFVRTTMVRVRPGRGPDYEEQLKMAQGLGGQFRVVSQSVAGQNATIYYITSFGKSMADLDTPGLPQLLGDRYAKYSKMTSENVLGVETIISRYIPEFSNPPAEVAAADPAFWNPKPKPAAAKPKSATSTN